MSAIAALLMIPAFAVIFVGFWTVIVRLIGAFGWAAVARHYAAAADPSGPPEVRWGSLKIGGFFGTSYRGCVNAWTTSDGIALRPAMLFGSGHPALLLPWREMKRVEDHGSYVRRTVVQMAADVPTLVFYYRLGEIVIDEWQRTTLRRKD